PSRCTIIAYLAARDTTVMTSTGNLSSGNWIIFWLARKSKPKSREPLDSGLAQLSKLGCSLSMGQPPVSEFAVLRASRSFGRWAPPNCIVLRMLVSPALTFSQSSGFWCSLPGTPKPYLLPESHLFHYFLDLASPPAR